MSRTEGIPEEINWKSAMSGPEVRPDENNEFPDIRTQRSGVGPTSDMMRRWL